MRRRRNCTSEGGGMALIECAACGKQVSEAAAACPNCGHPIKPLPAAPTPVQHIVVEQKRGGGCSTIVAAVGLLFLLLLALGQCMGTRPREADPYIAPSAMPVSPNSPAASAPSASWKEVGSSGFFHFVEGPANEDTYRTAAAAVCGTQAICQVGFWTSGAPRGLPMTDAQVAARKAQYGRNLNTGHNEWTWACDVNPSECSP